MMTTACNATGNTVAERVHKTQLRMLIAEHPPTDIQQAHALMDNCIASIVHTMWMARHRTLQVSPGSLVFQRDMLLPIPVLADYNLIRERSQAVIDNNNHRANLRWRFKDYKAGDQVLLLTQTKSKLKPKATGPYTIVQVHVNGTVTIQRGPRVTERINLRRIKPYNA